MEAVFARLSMASNIPPMVVFTAKGIGFGVAAKSAALRKSNTK